MTPKAGGTLLIVGMVFLSITAAGCGGGASGPSKSAYVQRIDRACTGARSRTTFGVALRRLSNLPPGPYARMSELRSVGRSVSSSVHQLAAKIRAVPAPEGDQPAVDRWLDDLRKLAVLTGQAAATERRIISLEAHHPGVVARSGTVRNADLDHALEAKLAAARAARAYGLAGCARLLGRP